MQPIADRETTASGQSDALRRVLDQLGERVKPVVFARERTMPLAEPLHDAFPEQALVRGRVVSCRGAAAASIADVVVRDAVIAGAWLAVVDLDTFGLDAAAEFGVPLERVVRIETGVVESTGTDLDWIDVMGAAVDGFDLVVTTVPAGLCGDRRPAAVRKLASRIQQRGAVVVAIGESGALSSDIDLITERTVWDGLGDGVGHLRRRQIDLVAQGRRAVGTRTLSLQFVGEANRVGVSTGEPIVRAVGAVTVVDVAERDPQMEVLSELLSDGAESLDAAGDLDRRLAG